ncbi:MAG: hypothetical protein EP343_09915 [Deltaproteobacteria bacterium]|nr:MAG: hypothetical protein EP343_09915 [Deltaproteobacteria bacterium]
MRGFGLGIVGWLVCFFSAQAQTKPAQNVPLTLLFTPDIGGHLQGFRCQKPGEKAKAARFSLAHLLGQVQTVRKAHQQAGKPQPLLFNTGDFLGPRHDIRFLLSQPKGKGATALADLFLAFGYDLIGIGNHEFSVSLQALDTFLQKSRRNALQFSASNLVGTESRHPLHIVINRDKLQQKRSYFVFQTQPFQGKQLRIAVFHLVPQDMPVAGKRLLGLRIAPPIAHAKQVMEQIRKEKLPVDLTVVMSHLGHTNSANRELRQLAKEVPGIDVILTNGLRDGSTHTQTVIYTNRKGEHVYMVGGGKYGRMLHRVDLQLRKPSNAAKATLVDVKPISMPLQSQVVDAGWQQKLQGWENTYCKRWGIQLGTGRIPSGKAMTYKNFLEYVLNVLRHTTKSELAVINEGAIRSRPFPLKQFITADDLYQALPFNSKLVRVTLTGKELLRWFLPRTGSIETLDEEMAYAGWSPKQKQVNGRAVEPNKIYQFVTIEYVVSRQRTQLLRTIRKLKSNLKPTVASRRALVFAQRKLKKLDSMWKVITYPTCNQQVKLSDPCSSRCCPKLRTLLRHHFKNDQFRSWSRERQRRNPALAQSSQKLPGTIIPYDGKVLELNEAFAWSLDTSIALAFDSNHISPVDLVGARSYPRIPTDFFTQYQFSGTLNIALHAGTRSHQWDSNFLLHYGAYIRSQTVVKERGALGISDIFDEVNDQVLLNTQYRYQRIKRFRPLVRAELQTELTRRGRPNLSDTAYVETLNQIRYRSFSLEGEVGFEVDAVPKYLIFGLSVSAKREFALEQFPDFGSPDMQTYPNIGGFPDTNFLPGFVLLYRTGELKLLSLGQRVMTFQSMGRYTFRLSVPVDVKGASVQPTHELELDNVLSFALTSYLSMAFRLRAIFYQGTLQKDSSDPRVRVPGPWAFWLTPSAMLQLRWGTRGQSIQ